LSASFKIGFNGTFNRKQSPYSSENFIPHVPIQGVVRYIEKRVTPMTETTPSSSGMLDGPA